MRPRPRARSAPLFFAVVSLLLPSCGGGSGTALKPDDAPQSSAPTARFPDPTEKVKPQTDLLKNEIPADQLDAVMRAHLQGLGRMEQYEYREAVRAFREVVERAPGWIPGAINLAIALLNDTGTQAEDGKKAGGGGSGGNFDEALALLDEVVRRDPANLNAHYCRGLILEFLGQGKTVDAHKDFLFVAEHDPSDGHAWFKVGATLTAPDDSGQPAGPEQAQQLIEIYSKALDRNPYLVTALYKLQQAYGWSRKREKQAELLDRWRKLNPKTNAAGPGDTAEAFYGESGKYAKVINPFQVPKGPTEVPPEPRFDPPRSIKVKLGPGERWVSGDEKEGKDALFGPIRERFGRAVVSFDADGDGRADLFLGASVKGPKGVRDALLLNKGDGAFEDVSHAWGLPDDRGSVGAAAADFDADRRVDLFLTGPTGYHLLRNIGGAKFEDVTAKAGMAGADRFGLTARWLDLDQDGDLDLYVVNITDLAHAQDVPGAAPKVTNSAYRNDGKPAAVAGRPQDNWAPLAVAPPDLPAKEGLSVAFAPWPDSDALVGPPANSFSVAALDVDGDRDLDLIVSTGGEDATPRMILNDRLGKFHQAPMKGLPNPYPVDKLLVTDVDKDGRPDLAAAAAHGKNLVWRNVTDPTKTPVEVSWESWACEGYPWRTVEAADLDLDTWPDLVGATHGAEFPQVGWLRNDATRLSRRSLKLGPWEHDDPSFNGFALADVAGDPLPDLVLLANGRPPQVARNLGNGNHWIALDLGGRWKTSFDHMRTNPHGLGTRVTIEGRGLLVTYDHTTPSANLGQSIGPVVLGLGQSPSAELIRLRWPDGTMQCELNTRADTRLALAEYNRKRGSCPVLFTWNGARFVCLGDFLGGGGLGYLVAPGVYSQPDRDESVAIAPDQLRAVDGVFRLSITEPMDEVAYLDKLTLVAVDRPPGVSTAPDERFAPEGPRPTGEVIAWKESVAPVKATDLKGRDVTKTLLAWDRESVDDFKRLGGWVGYAEEHGIVLDFGDRLARFGPRDPLVLVLAGWVEYPYSQTNYAAATAGVALRPPVVERRNDDGSWTVIEPDAGYPAGLPRQTTLDLTGKLGGARCVVRLRTNMECYWDQAFVAPRDRSAEAALRQTSLAVGRAELGHRGFTREVSPDGRQPLLYDYDYVDPAPLALMAGRLTRHGDVRPLLADDDDQLCLVGPGDEVRLEFDARTLPALPVGWTRAYLLRAVGYCKDADPHTATSDRVGPLPWKAMPPFPFADDIQRPEDASYRAYLNDFQSRPAGVR